MVIKEIEQVALVRMQRSSSPRVLLDMRSLVLLLREAVWQFLSHGVNLPQVKSTEMKSFTCSYVIVHGSTIPDTSNAHQLMS